MTKQPKTQPIGIDPLISTVVSAILVGALFGSLATLWIVKHL